MPKTIPNTLKIIKAAVDAMAFRRTPIPAVNGPEIVILAVLILGLQIALGFACTEDDTAYVSVWGLSTTLAILGLEAGLLLLAGVRKRCLDLGGLLAILLAIDVVAVLPVIGAAVFGDLALEVVVRAPEPRFFVTGGASMVWFAWQFCAVWRLCVRATVLKPRRFAVAVALATIAPMVLLPVTPIVTGQPGGRSAGLLQDGFNLVRSKQSTPSLPRIKPLNVEAIFARQGQLIDAQLDALVPTRPGSSQFYFVGMAPYAGQDVFKREITSAHAIMNERFATGGHSVVMVNHRDTLSTLPLATAYNLERVLWRVAQLMDRENDVLVLYITSHGAEGIVSVDMAGLELNDVTPSDLAELLVRTGIRHKVVIISACHSGSFIPALAGPDTLVMAAARADRASFGCSNERDWTYFGDALFNHALRETHSLIDGFDRARTLVGTWEKQQKLTPASEPQISIGTNIAVKLDALSQKLNRRPASAAN